MRSPDEAPACRLASLARCRNQALDGLGLSSDMAFGATGLSLLCLDLALPTWWRCVLRGWGLLCFGLDLPMIWLLVHGLTHEAPCGEAAFAARF